MRSYVRTQGRRRRELSYTHQRSSHHSSGFELCAAVRDAQVPKKKPNAEQEHVLRRFLNRVVEEKRLDHTASKAA